MSQFNLLVLNGECSKVAEKSAAFGSFPKVIKLIDGIKQTALIIYDELIGCLKNHSGKYESYDECIKSLKKSIEPSDIFVLKNLDTLRNEFVELKGLIENLLKTFNYIDIITYHEFGGLEETSLETTSKEIVKFQNIKIEDISFLKDNKKLRIVR